MTRATIRDVAKKAGVGVGTVSRVLNNNPSVSEETREKVLSVINDLDFTPNPIARQLSTGRTLTIGVILPHLTMPSYVERLRGVQNALAASEYDLVLFSVETPEQRDAYFNNLSRTSRVDGVIIISIPPTDEQANKFSDSRIPTVLVDACHPQLNCVIGDDFKGGLKATHYLIELGHKKIAFLGDYLETPFQPSMRDRFNGYKQALMDEGIPFRNEYHIEVENERSQSCAMAKKLLQLEDPPTAIFGGCDIQAIGILDGASELGVRIPQDLSIIGYDGIRDAEHLGLTTIKQHLFKSGVEGVKMLLGKLSQKSSEPHTKFIPFDLVVRDTAAPPRLEH